MTLKINTSDQNRVVHRQDYTKRKPDRFLCPIDFFLPYTLQGGYASTNLVENTRPLVQLCTAFRKGYWISCISALVAGDGDEDAV